MNEDRTAQQRRVTAFHEASHCVMSFALNLPVDVISIRPGEGYSGVMIGRPRGLPANAENSIGHAIPRLPASLRRHVESRVMVLLAGRLGGLLVGTEGFVGDDEDAVAALDEIHEGVRRSSLSAREQGLLDAAERDLNPMQSDQERALNLAGLVAMDDTQARLYLAWLRNVTASYVFTWAFRREVELIVPELLEHEVISGRKARSLIRGADPVRPVTLELAASID